MIKLQDLDSLATFTIPDEQAEQFQDEYEHPENLVIIDQF